MSSTFANARIRSVPAIVWKMGSSVPGGLETGLCLLLYVPQDAQVNLVDNPVRPFPPIHLRPKIVLVPRCALQNRAAITQRHQPELAPAGAHVVALKMRRRDLPRAQLAHGLRLRGDVEGQQPVFVPQGDRFHEITSREAAVSHRPRSRSHDLCGSRISDSCPKQPFLRCR